MEKMVIVSGARTGIGSFGGSLKQYQATDLGGFAIKAAVERAGLKPEDIDEVVMGCVGQAAENAFMARVSSIKAGIPYEASALICFCGPVIRHRGYHACSACTECTSVRRRRL